MKKTPMLLSLALLAIVSCNKEGSKGTEVPGVERMTFSASTASLTKAVFADGDDGSLEWSAYDNIGAYSYNSGSTLMHSGFASMSNFIGADAVFTSSDTRAVWAGSVSGGDVLTFYAYYPQLSAPVAAVSEGVVQDLSVSPTQNGAFGKYHICYSAPVEISANNLTAGDPVSFSFSPATSMIRVRPVLSDDSDVDYVQIKQLVINIAGGVAIAGDCDLTLANGALSSSGSSYSTIRVTLPKAVNVTKTAANNEYIAAVVLPAISANKVLSFSVVGADGTSYTMPGKLSPSKFEPGTRYNLDREIRVLISTDTTPDGQYIDGGDAWSSEETVEDAAYTDGGAAW